MNRKALVIVVLLVALMALAHGTSDDEKRIMRKWRKVLKRSVDHFDFDEYLVLKKCLYGYAKCQQVADLIENRAQMAKRDEEEAKKEQGPKRPFRWGRK